MGIPTDHHTNPPFFSPREREEMSCFGDYPNILIQAALDSFIEMTCMITKIGQSLFKNCFEDVRERPSSSSAAFSFEMRLREVKATSSSGSDVSYEFARIRSTIIHATSARDIFGIEADAPLVRSEIALKYRKTVIVLHPDKNPNNELEASRLFHCVQQAYEVLNENNS
jgi:hypothetical protein